MQITIPEQKKSSQHSAPVEKRSRHVREFIAKFNHDGMMLASAGLAYNLMIAVAPFGIAILAVLGLTLGNLNPQAQAQLVHQISHAFPSVISSQNVLQPAITRLNQSAGFLAIIAVATAIFGGSRLFIAIERCFDIVYRTYPRKTISQHVMALLMMLVFIILTPVMVLASSLPALMLSLIQSSALSQVPFIMQLAHNGVVLGTASLLGGIVVGWILFQTVYMAVPNQRIGVRHSWRGAVTAAILLEIFLVLFPFYITHFMSSYTGVVGFAAIFLLFFYYFAMILLFGAQINAYFAEDIRPLPDTLATVLCDAVGHAASEPDRPAHVTHLSQVPTPAPSGNSQEAGTDPATTEQLSKQAPTDRNAPAGRAFSNLFGLGKKCERKPVTHSSTGKKARSTGATVQALAGTALAFTITVIRLRTKSRP